MALRQKMASLPLIARRKAGMFARRLDGACYRLLRHAFAWPRYRHILICGFPRGGTSTVPGATVHFVKYEELITNSSCVEGRLGEELGVHFTYDFASFHERKEGHPYSYQEMRPPVDASYARESNPIDHSRLGKWMRAEHHERIREQFSRHPELFDMLKRYGYEYDDRWFEAYKS